MDPLLAIPNGQGQGLGSGYPLVARQAELLGRPICSGWPCWSVSKLGVPMAGCKSPVIRCYSTGFLL